MFTRADARDAVRNTTSSRLIHVLNIYLVEDSLVIRDSLIATLEELLPVEVVGTAADEATAVRWLSNPERPVDLVIVDIFLQGGSGLGVLKAAQGLPHRYRMVVLSNYATPAMRRNCLALGAEQVFDKSNEIEALIAYCAAVAAGDFPDSSPVAALA
jgi:DNA-binding NarL/FixJ family response regulator